VRNKIISLQEVNAGRWVAKYQGNYGVYTIRMRIDERGNGSDYSCSCPSDYYPCKHIGFIEQAIAERRIDRTHESSGSVPTPEELLQDLPLQYLRAFVLKQAQHNDSLRNAILMEFAPKAKNRSGNPYSGILRNALEDTLIDDDELWQYNDSSIQIDVMDDMLEKARIFILEEKYNEAVFIAKACIEEFSSWYAAQGSDIRDYIDPDYFERPFEILGEIADKNGWDARELYSYCEAELSNGKHSKSGMNGGFNELLLSTAIKTGNMKFPAFQDKLMEEVRDNSSYEAEQILKRKIDFYNAAGYPEKADEIMEANLQIRNFRIAAIEKRIATGNFADAKALIFQYPLPDDFHQRRTWEEMLLTIAQKENDIPKIRETAFKFIADSFNKEYYAIYKSAFSPEEWKEEVERLITHYEPKVNVYWGSDYVADVLAAEGMAARLLDYIANNPTLEKLQRYYKYICEQFPEKTLSLFRKAADSYADKNVGEKYYEHIAAVLRQMREIQNGDAVVNEMLAQYRILYKRRSAMMRTLTGV